MGPAHTAPPFESCTRMVGRKLFVGALGGLVGSITSFRPQLSAYDGALDLKYELSQPSGNVPTLLVSASSFKLLCRTSEMMQGCACSGQ